MRIAYLDCFSGMSGDMFLGALVDAGVSPELLEKTVAALNVGARLEISRVDRSGITATKVDVFVQGEKEVPREEAWEPGEHGHLQSHSAHLHEHQHVHSHEHEEAHSHRSEILHHQGHEGSRRGSGNELREHSHSHEPSRTGVSAPHEHEHAHGRGLSEIREIILRAALSEGAKKTAIAIFEALGAAEAKIHNVAIESIHFHEVGAVDAIVDIVGAAVGAEALGVDEIVCSPLNVGGGTVKCAHGEFPVPAQATVELLKGAPVYSSGIQKELVTPTGAAIVNVLATRFGAFPTMKIEKSGYGAGTRDLPGHANVVRLTVGEVTADVASLDAASRVSTLEHTITDTITVLEANLDDLNPQVFGYVMDRLLEEGALDAFAMPVQMKKNRPGTRLTVLCKPEDAAKLTRLIFAETTTLGVRRRDEQRQTLARRWVTVATQWGEVRMKVASLNGTVTNYAPEYEDCRRIAAEQHVPLKAVMQEATQAYLGDAAKKKP
jgi:pyridinium-3,5-bisthiocarboxylic acid mononucleotide nickel chelatase